MKSNKWGPIVIILAILFSIMFSSKEVLSETFIVGFRSDWYPPFYFKKGSHETGIYVDILYEIGRVTGDDFKIKYYRGPEKHMAFEKGLIDIGPGVNPAWREEYDNISVYTVPFGRATDVMLFRKDSKFPVKSILDLREKNVGTVRGYVYPGYMEYFNYGSIKRSDSANEEQLLLGLIKGHTDLAFINKTVARYFLSRHHYDCEYGNIISNVEVMFRLHISKKYALGRFDRTLRKLIENGTIEKIYAKYR